MFARYRRKMGDDRIDTAWHKASFKVSVYLGFLSVACLLVLVAAIYSLADINFPAAHKRPWQVFAGIVGVLTGILLDGDSSGTCHRTRFWPLGNRPRKSRWSDGFG